MEQLQKNSRQTQTMINIGRAADLLDREMQEHLRILQRKCQFDYVRIWDIFSRDLMIDIAHVQGAYNFRKLDQVLDLILELHMIPDLDKKEQRVNADVNDTMIYEKGTVMFDSLGAWQRLWSSVLTHWLERYGRECLEKWKVEVWYGGYQIGGYSEYRKLFSDFAETGRLMKEKIPGMQLGGPGIFPGCMSDQTENHFFRQWAAQDMIQQYVVLSPVIRSVTYCWAGTSELMLPSWSLLAGKATAGTTWQTACWSGRDGPSRSCITTMTWAAGGAGWPWG
ncbi:MAG: hypothetical protein V8R46_03175 [Eubacterium ramulus]